MNEDVLAIHCQEIALEDHKHISKNTGNVSYEQYFFNDEDTGMYVKIIRYPKGSITPLHTHHCAHGMYVLKGTLYTNKGDFEPGSFVWFKEGSVMTHGGKDEDVECLFITNKAFDIQYL
jgi:anti-sigma factor ChrR (cupin superfamily)